MNNCCNISILEEFPLMGIGLKSIFDKIDFIKVIDVSKNILALSKLETLQKTDVLVMDITHSKHLKFSTINKVKQILPETPVVFLSRKKSVNNLVVHLLPKVHGFVLIDGKTTITDLKKAIEKVLSGENYYPGNIKKIFRKNSNSESSSLNNALTEREIAVLKLFCGGLTYKEIGNKLYISPRTVESHKNNILSKLQVRTTADMIKFAYRNDILN